MPPPFEVVVARKCLNFPAMAMRPDGKKGATGSGNRHSLAVHRFHQ